MKRYFPGGISGRLLKAHLASAISRILPCISEVLTVVVAFSEVDPRFEDVVMSYRPMAAVLTQLLCDPSVSGANSERLDMLGVDQRELSASPFIHCMHCSKPGAPVICGDLFHDGAAVGGAHMARSYCPVCVSVSEHCRAVKLSKGGMLVYRCVAPPSPVLPPVYVLSL